MEGSSRAAWRTRLEERPALVTFYSLTSDAPLLDPRVRFPTLTVPEPRPGDTRVVLDADGRLERFRIDPREGRADGGSPSWVDVFRMAELDPEELQELPTPPLDGAESLPVHDARWAWAGWQQGKDLRIDAASFGSLPVFFRISSNRPEPSRDYETISQWIFVAFTVVLLLAAAIALANVRRRRGDFRGAAVLSGCVAATSFLGELSAQHHGPGFFDGRALAFVFSTVLPRVLIVAVLYLAMEPMVRARQPDLVVSWARLVRGRWRDSRVGRDALFGVSMGLLLPTTYLYLRHLWDPSPWVAPRLEESLAGAGTILGLLGELIFGSTTGTLAAALCLAFLQRWLKHRWLAAGLLAVAVVALSQEVPPGLLVLVLAAAGVLATIFAWAAFALVVLMPATGDPSLWWAWPEAWSLSALLLLVAIVAFRNATGLGLRSRAAGAY